MGHRLEMYVAPQYAQTLIDISNSFGIKAQIIGRVEGNSGKKVTIQTPDGEFVY